MEASGSIHRRGYTNDALSRREGLRLVDLVDLVDGVDLVDSRAVRRYSSIPLAGSEDSDSTELAEILSHEAEVLCCRPLRSTSQARRAPKNHVGEVGRKRTKRIPFHRRSLSSAFERSISTLGLFRRCFAQDFHILESI